MRLTPRGLLGLLPAGQSASLRITSRVSPSLMALYAIVLDRPSDHAWAKLRETWPVHHIRDDRVAFISSADNALTSEISKEVGIGAENNISGIVVQMDYYSGHTSAPLVEWLRKNS